MILVTILCCCHIVIATSKEIAINLLEMQGKSGLKSIPPKRRISRTTTEPITLNEMDIVEIADFTYLGV